MKKAAVLLLFLLPVIFVACGGVSATQVERALYSKLDQGDVAGALALTTEDAVFDIPGCPDGGCKGKDAVKGAFEGAVAQHTRHTVKSSKDSGNTATSQVEDELDLAKAAGVQRVVLKVDLEVKGGKIVRYRAQFDTSDPQTATVVNFRGVSGLHRQFVDAVARGDVSGALALFNDDAVIEGRGVCVSTPCVGKEAIRKEVERVVNAHSATTLTNVQVSGNATTARVAVQSDATRAAGIERLVGDQTLEERGGKIAAIRFKIDASDQQTATFQNFSRLSRILRQHYDAVNKGDAAAAVAIFADDAVMVRGSCSPLNPCKTRAEIQRAIQSEVGNQTRIDVINSQGSGNTVTARIEFRNVNVKNFGVERAIFNVTASFAGEKISRLIHERDDADSQTAIFGDFQRVVGVVVGRGTAHRRGDVAAVMGFFTDDAVLEGIGLCAAAPCTGRAAIQKEMERQVADKFTATGISGSDRVSGDTFTNRVQIASDLIKAAGVERIIASPTQVVKGDKLSSIRFVLDLSDPQTATFANFQRLSGILRQLYDVGNRGDVATTAAFFTADATLVRGGCNPQAPCVGTAAIQRQLEREPTLQFRYSVINVQVSGDTATGRVEFRNINIKNAGQERVIENVTATFKDDKISRLAHALDLSDSQTAAFANFRRMAVINSRYTDALSIGNVAGAMAALTEDAVVEGYGLCAAAPCAGKAAIQKEVERQVADKTKIATVGGTARVTGDTWTGRVEVRSDSIKAAGVERIIAAQTVEAKGDKASSYRWVLDATDPQTATYLKSQAK